MTESEILSALNTIMDPCSVASGRPLGLGDMGLIEALEIGNDGAVSVNIRLTAPSCLMVGYFMTEIRKTLLSIEGVSTAQVTHDLGDSWSPELMAPQVQAERAQRFNEMRSRFEASMQREPIALHD